MSDTQKVSISTAARFLNISNECLRHYERIGLVAPERAENGYRFFSYQDLDTLQGVHCFRNMGFSLPEIDQLLNGDLGQLVDMLGEAEKRVQREQIWLEEMRAAIVRHTTAWKEAAGGLWQCALTTSPEMRWIGNRSRSALNSPEETDAASMWAARMPVSFVSPIFPMEELLSGADTIQFGFGIGQRGFDRLELPHIPGERSIEPHRAVLTHIESSGSGHISCASLAHVVAFCREHDLTICGDGWGVTLGGFTDAEGEKRRWHRVYVPVEE